MQACPLKWLFQSLHAPHHRNQHCQWQAMVVMTQVLPQTPANRNNTPHLSDQCWTSLCPLSARSRAISTKRIWSLCAGPGYIRASNSLWYKISCHGSENVFKLSVPPRPVDVNQQTTTPCLYVAPRNREDYTV